MKPALTVLMPVYNGEKYLGQAVESILDQTFAGFDLLIIDDCSSDRSVDIIRSYRDSRIRLVQNDRNRGLIGTLNEGIELAERSYIARMDQDDISMPERLRKQIEFMETHPEVAVCGCWAVEIDENGNSLRKRETPVGPQMVKDCWRPSPIIHPSAFMRTAIAKKYTYDKNFIDAEDYELWLRIAKDHPIDNIPEYLLHYRMNSSGITNVYRQRQLQSTYAAFRKHVAYADVTYDEFCSLLFLDSKVHPLRRIYKSRRLLLRGSSDIRSFVADNRDYFNYWRESRHARP